VSDDWKNLYDEAKDRRYGFLFFLTLLIFIVLPVVVGVISECTDWETRLSVLTYVLPVAVAIVCVWVWRWISRGRNGRDEALKNAGLSRNELFKARSKLRKQLKPVGYKYRKPRYSTRPVRRDSARVPDTDLKY